MTTKQDAAEGKAEAKAEKAEAKQLATDQAAADQAAADRAAEQLKQVGLARGIPGDATKEQVDELLLKNLREQLAIVPPGGERTVTIDAATATMLLELLPAEKEAEEK
jgi:hypothetical protein